MTFTEAKQIAAVVKQNKPDEVSGTVGEKLLWAHFARELHDRCYGAVSSRSGASWNDAQWREAAGWEG